MKGGQPEVRLRLASTRASQRHYTTLSCCSISGLTDRQLLSQSANELALASQTKPTKRGNGYGIKWLQIGIVVVM